MSPAASTRLAFAWSGFPDYAARCIRAVIDGGRYKVSVVGTQTNVPLEGLERSLGQPIHWIDGSDRRATWRMLGLDPPDVFFQGGFHLPSFSALGRDCRRAGGRVVLLSDRSARVDAWRRIADRIRYRLGFSHWFDAVFVPGASGRKAALAAGWSEERVVEGLLGGDPRLFNDGGPVARRAKEFLFVGRFVGIKNVVGLTKTFSMVADKVPDWRLRLCGSGPDLERLTRHPQILVEPFLQPDDVAERMRSARCLVLPSRYEAWGVVVHEATLSGCALILSDVVGALDDLATDDNSIVVPSGDMRALASAFLAMASWDEERWHRAEKASRQLAARFGPERFAQSVERLVRLLSGSA